MILMIPLFLWLPISQNPNGTIAVVASFIPPASPFVMVLRLTASTEPVPTWIAVGGQVGHDREDPLGPRFAWNEYAFAVLLTSGTAQTAPPFIPTIIGVGKDWPAVAAGTTLFLVPVMVFTILLRKHLLRGITFGAVRK